MKSDLRVVLCTAPDGAVAETLARALVEARLAACVNIVPGVRSVYRWQDRVQEDQEVLLVVKTAAECVAALEERLVSLHPYEVPEFVVLAAEHVSAPYLAWALGATQ